MKKRACSLLLLNCLSWSARAQGTVEAITAFVPGSVSGTVVGTAGWNFQPTQGIQVTDLGCLNFLILDQGPVLVGLWNSAGTLLASTTVSATNVLVGETRYASVPSFFLSAGQTYTMGAYSDSGTIS